MRKLLWVACFFSLFFSATVYGETTIKDRITARVTLIDKTQTETKQNEIISKIVDEEVIKGLPVIQLVKLDLVKLNIPELNFIKTTRVEYSFVKLTSLNYDFVEIETLAPSPVKIQFISLYKNIILVPSIKYLRFSFLEEDILQSGSASMVDGQVIVVPVYAKRQRLIKEWR